MSPLVIPSPLMLDQSFPRDHDELIVASISLGELENLIRFDGPHLLLTCALRELVEAIEWENQEDSGLLREIYLLMNRWFLQPHDAIHMLDGLPCINRDLHPFPDDCESGELVQYWCEEVAKLLQVHRGLVNDGSFFIGIGCASAFAGRSRARYRGKADDCFPLIGPGDIEGLADAYEWILPDGIHGWLVSFRDAKKNLAIIGAERVSKPAGGSHYRVIFRGERTWVLDPNNDPIPLRFINQLTCITKLPLNVIKFALVTGDLPERRFRLHEFIV